MSVVAPRRVAMLSVHTSPLEQPGTGDAGGMNVYVNETARRLAARGTEVEIFTRATSSDLPPTVKAADGVLVRHVVAGPFSGLAKQDLPAQLCAFSAGLVRAEAWHDEGWYDLVHSHYWLSGHVGLTVAARWGVPLVHTMHTMAKVKNAALADGDAPEPMTRVVGEQNVVDGADRLVANTLAEARELHELYGASPEQLVVAQPGVDLEVFRPGSRSRARAHVGLPQDALVALFVGRLQPLKGPDVIVRAVGELLARRPDLRGRLVVAVVGGPSGTGLERPDQLRELSEALGVAASVKFVPPTSRERLAQWYRAADVLVMPSHNESFGLVALEAQACGTPVIAAAVGGLRTAVEDGATGLLVDGHDPLVWARALEAMLEAPQARERMSAAAVRHAAGYSWDVTVDALLETYAEAAAVSAYARRTGVPALAG